MDSNSPSQTTTLVKTVTSTKVAVGVAIFAAFLAFANAAVPLVNDAVTAVPTVSVQMIAPATGSTLDRTVRFYAKTSSKVYSLKFILHSTTDTTIADRSVRGTTLDGMTWTATFDTTSSKDGGYVLYAAVPVSTSASTVSTIFSQQNAVKVFHIPLKVTGVKLLPAVFDKKADETTRTFTITFDNLAENVKVTVSEAGVVVGEVIPVKSEVKGQRVFVTDPIKGLKYNTAYEYSITGCVIAKPDACVKSTGTFKTAPTPQIKVSSVKASLTPVKGKPDQTKWSVTATFDKPATNVRAVLLQGSAEVARIDYTKALLPSQKKFTIDLTDLKYATDYDVMISGDLLAYPVSNATGKTTFKTGPAPTDSATAVAGTLTVTLAPEDKETMSGYILGGSSNVIIGKYVVTSKGQPIVLNKIRFAATPSATISMSLYDGVNRIAGPSPVPSSGIVDFIGLNMGIKPESPRVLTVKADIRTVGPSGASTGTPEYAVFYGDVGLEAYGTTDGLMTRITKNTGEVVIPSIKKYLRKSIPRVDLVSLPTTNISNGTVTAMRFSVSADPAGDVAVKKLSFETAHSFSGATLIALDGVRRVGDGSILPMSGASSGACTGSGTCTMSVTFNNEEVIAAGTSKTYELRVAVYGAPTTSGDTMSTRMLGDSKSYGSSSVSARLDNLVADGYNFFWSDLSVVPHQDDLTGGTVDWASGWLVSGLYGGSNRQEMYRQ